MTPLRAAEIIKIIKISVRKKTFLTLKDADFYDRHTPLRAAKIIQIIKISVGKQARIRPRLRKVLPCADYPAGSTRQHSLIAVLFHCAIVDKNHFTPSQGVTRSYGLTSCPRVVKG